MKILCFSNKREYSGRLTVFRRGKVYEAFESGGYLYATADDGVEEAVAFEKPYNKDPRFKDHFEFV